MPVTCLGEHETVNFPCYRAKRSSCGRACGRSLACGNHTCTIICHIPTNNNSKEDKVKIKIIYFNIYTYGVFHRIRSLKVFMEGVVRKFSTLRYLCCGICSF